MSMFHHHSRGGKRLLRKKKSKNNSGVRLAALLLCLSMLTGFLPALARAADGGPLLSDNVTFGSITLHYAAADGESPDTKVQDEALLKKTDNLVLKYTYTITEDQCNRIQAETNYYLEVSPHLVLPNLAEGKSLTDGGGEQFGTLYADGSSAWVTFNDTLSDYAGLNDAYFYLTCNRAGTVPAGATEEEKKNNLYTMNFENGTQLKFGYEENKPSEPEDPPGPSQPTSVKAQINSKSGSLNDKTIIWTTDYTPWQNPAEGDGVTLDTPFELRDTVDASQHSYVPGSAKIDGSPVTAYTFRGDIPPGAETYVLVETPAGGNTTLTFGGTKFNAVQGTPAKPKITYETKINDELLLPKAISTVSTKVTNTTELFADGDDGFQSLNIKKDGAVTISQPTWLAKTGTTTRDPGNGATAEWTVSFIPNGFDFADGNKLTLHDKLPNGSTLVDGSVTVDGEAATATTGANNEVTIFPITTKTNRAPVIIKYKTWINEGMYDSGASLGKNEAWFTFQYGSRNYKTPSVTKPVDRGDGMGSDTPTLLKTHTGYIAATRSITWTVKINPHKANLKGGTFTDDLGAVGSAACGKEGHGHGLELVGGVDGITIKINGSAPTDDEKALIELAYDQQILTITAGEIGTKAVTLIYTTKVCDPCVFANNTQSTAFKNTISTDGMILGSQPAAGRSVDSTADVSATVLTKKAPVYDYASSTMKWTVEVDAAGLSMSDVVLTDELQAGLSYVNGSLVTAPEISGASASVDGQTLTINLGAVTGKTTVTFETAVDPKVLGFGGDTSVVVKNTVCMNGSADNVPFSEVSNSVQQSFSNHGLVKKNTVDNTDELIQYEVLINPYHLALPENPSLVDTLDKRLQLDTDSLKFYQANLSGTTNTSGQKPAYEKIGDGQSLEVAGFDPSTNSFTVQLPVSAGDQSAYVLTYTADIIKRQAGGYSNNVRFEGDDLLLGGSKDNSAAVTAPPSGGGGGGGGGGVAARKATISIVKTDSETGAPIPDAAFTLYQWNGAERGLAVKQEVTGKDGKLSFRVKPNETYLLEESAGAPGYGSAMGWANLPDGVEEKDGTLLIPAGAAKSVLTLNLTNEAHTTDIVFRLVNKSGIPMVGSSVKIFTSDPTGQGNPTSAGEATVSFDGTVRFSSMRRGARYFIQRPGGGIMTIEVPAEEDKQPKVTVDGKTETLTEDYRAEGSALPEQEWTLTVTKVNSGSKAPLAGATIGLYADADCQILIKKGISQQDGTITFSGLIRGQSYWLKETAAPNGYQLNSKTYEGTEGTPNITIENTPSPVNPGNPGNPSDPSNPGNPSDPSNPGNPSDPSNPGNPSDPSNPGNPSDPSNPVNPSDPSNPGNPSDPSNPVNPSDPSNPGNPSDPSNPVNPSDPSNPVNPSDPSNPGIGNVTTGDPNIPQTGDNTQLLVLVTLLSGIALVAMTLYRFLGQKKREKE